MTIPNEAPAQILGIELIKVSPLNLYIDYNVMNNGNINVLSKNKAYEKIIEKLLSFDL